MDFNPTTLTTHSFIVNSAWFDNQTHLVLIIRIIKNSMSNILPVMYRKSHIVHTYQHQREFYLQNVLHSHSTTNPTYHQRLQEPFDLKSNPNFCTIDQNKYDNCDQTFVKLDIWIHQNYFPSTHITIIEITITIMFPVPPMLTQKKDCPALCDIHYVSA